METLLFMNQLIIKHMHKKGNVHFRVFATLLLLSMWWMKKDDEKNKENCCLLLITTPHSFKQKKASPLETNNTHAHVNLNQPLMLG